MNRYCNPFTIAKTIDVLSREFTDMIKKMKINRLSILPFILSILVQFAESFLFEGIGIGIGAFTALGYGAFHCKYYECCDDYNIPFNATSKYTYED